MRAFSECLAGELVDADEIEVATIVPQAIDTPIFEHGGNYTGRQVRPIPPVLDVEQVARGIELCAENPKREVNYGQSGRALEILHAAAPPLYRRFAHLAFLRGTLGDVAADPAPGNVLESRGPHAVEGGWRTRRRGTLRAPSSPRRAARSAACSSAAPEGRPRRGGKNPPHRWNIAASMIAVIADTHMPKGRRALPEACVRADPRGRGVIHAGDFSAASVLADLRELCPAVLGVHGNVDDAELRRELPEG